MKDCAIALILLAAAGVSVAAQPTLESIAAEIARQHNSNAAAMTDEMIVSSSAKSIGKNVIFKYIQRVRRDVPPDKLLEYKSELIRDMTPKVCHANANNPAFKEGLYYTFRYESHYGQKLVEFSVDKRVCAGR